MTKKLLIFALFIFIGAGTVLAQTAQVIQLSPTDAAKAKQLYTEKAQILSEIHAFKTKIQEKYVPHSSGIFSLNDPSIVWGNGFEFSTDYKFIVPKYYVQSLNNNTYSCIVPVGKALYDSKGQ